MRRQAIDLLLLALVAGLIGACSPAQGAPQVWIDMPLNGSNLPLFAVWVGSHAAAPAGIAEVELSVDGAVVVDTLASPPAETLLYTRQMWSPAAPGTYTLKVRARSLKGAWGEALAAVTIGSQATATPTAVATRAGTPTPTTTHPASATSTPTATPTHVASATPTPAATATHTRAPTATYVPTATPTQPPTARPTPVPPTDTPVPPTAAPPAIGDHTASSSTFYYGDQGCGPKQVTIGVTASNASGVAIYYRLASMARGGPMAWASRDMTAVRGGWTCTLDSTADIAGYNPSLNVSYGLQFYFVASGAGGQTQRSTYGNEITLSRCTVVR